MFSEEVDGLMVELPLLLSVRRAEALVALSRERRESVGQILRRCIDEMLSSAPASTCEVC